MYIYGYVWIYGYIVICIYDTYIYIYIYINIHKYTYIYIYIYIYTYIHIYTYIYIWIWVEILFHQRVQASTVQVQVSSARPLLEQSNEYKVSTACKAKWQYDSSSVLSQVNKLLGSWGLLGAMTRGADTRAVLLRKTDPL